MNLVRKAWSLVRALTGGRDASLIADRLAKCQVCPHKSVKPIINQTTLKMEEKLFCNECGCGTYAIAELHHKLGYKALTCPKGFWGEATGMKPNQASQMITQGLMAEWKTNNPSLAAENERKQQEQIEKWKADQAARAGGNGASLSAPTPAQPLQGLYGVNHHQPTAIPEHVFRQSFRGRHQWPTPTGPTGPGPMPGAPQATGTMESPPPATTPTSEADPTPPSTEQP